MASGSRAAMTTWRFSTTWSRAAPRRARPTLGIRVSTDSLSPSVQARSTNIAIRGNTVSGATLQGIVAQADSLRGGIIADNETFANGANGIALNNDNPDNVVSGNLSYDNGRYGILVQGLLSAGNVVEGNTMHGNVLADAADLTDQTPADGIQLLNTWMTTTA